MTDSRPVSMQQIAQMLGTSRATVSNALRGEGRLSAELAEKIRRVATELNYVPSHAGRALRTGRSTLVGLVVPNFAIPLFSGFVQAFENAARARDMALLIGDSMGDAQRQMEELRNFVSRGCDALVIIPLRGSELDLDALRVPVAVVDSAANPLNTASCDHRDGGRQIARHLVEQGHRSVEILASALPSNVGAERVAGMAEVFRAAGVATRETRVHADFDLAREFGLSWRAEGVTAIAAAYDAVAVGVIAGLTAQGIRVPQQVSVTGFDDVIWGRIVTPQLTTIRQDLPAIAQHALDVATGKADGPRVFPTELILRGSTAAPYPQEMTQ